MRLDEILEGTADAAFAVDPLGEIRTWNKAAESLFGWTRAATVGRNCAEVFAGSTHSGVPICRPDCHVLICSRRSRTVPNFDMRVRTVRGERPVNVSVLTLSDPRSGLLHTVHFVREAKTDRPDEAPGGNTAIGNLTPQERNLLQLLAAGRSSAEVIAELRISASTMRNHLTNINQKLGTRNRLGAVLQAIRNGLID